MFPFQPVCAGHCKQHLSLGLNTLHPCKKGTSASLSVALIQESSSTALNPGHHDLLSCRDRRKYQNQTPEVTVVDESLGSISQPYEPLFPVQGFRAPKIPVHT